MLQLEVLIGKLLTIDGLATSAITTAAAASTDSSRCLPHMLAHRYAELLRHAALPSQLRPLASVSAAYSMDVTIIAADLDLACYLGAAVTASY